MTVRRSALVLVVALLAAACGNAKSDSGGSATTTPGETVASKVNESDLKVHHPIDETGVTDDEIRVSVVADITNPLGADYTAFANGIDAYFSMVNSEGGLYGRKLKIVNVRDDQLANNATEVQAALAQDNPFAVFIGTSLFTGANTLASQNVPTFGININEEWTGHDTFFPNTPPLCLTCPSPIMPWLVQQLGLKKVGAVAYNVPQSADNAKGTVAAFEKWPTAKVVFSDMSIPFGVTDVSAQVAQMKQKGVEIAYLATDLNGSFTFAKEMRKQGLDIPLFMPNAYDHDFMKANGKYFEGSHVVTQFTALEQEPQPAEMKTMLAQVEKADKEVKENTVWGWIAANEFVTGLKLAGPDFNRAKVVAALNAQTNFTANGMVSPIDWTQNHEKPKDRLTPNECYNLVKIQNNEFVSEFAKSGKPWVCFYLGSDNSTTGSELPEPTNYSFADASG